MNVVVFCNIYRVIYQNARLSLEKLKKRLKKYKCMQAQIYLRESECIPPPQQWHLKGGGGLSLLEELVQPTPNPEIFHSICMFEICCGFSSHPTSPPPCRWHPSPIYINSWGSLFHSCKVDGKIYRFFKCVNCGCVISLWIIVDNFFQSQVSRVVALPTFNK